MYRLYYYPGNASLIPHLLLREIGAEHRLEFVDRQQNAQRQAAHLARVMARPAARQAFAAEGIAEPFY